MPRDRAGNLKFRRELSRWWVKDEHFRRLFHQACRDDLLFWITTVLWTFDPRKERSEMPWVLWDPYQTNVLRQMEEHLGKRDIHISKSRDQGASWNCLALLLHEWQFKTGQSFMLLSRKESLVDGHEGAESDSLFWKLDFMTKCQPRFILPENYARTKLHLTNVSGRSYMDGSSSTGDAGRGGRRRAIMVDEMAAWELADQVALNAATANNTNCRMFNSTYKGAVGEFYEQGQRDDIVKIRMPWWEHPEHSQGLKVGADGKRWSPWYAGMCNRLRVPAIIAAELDMDPTASASPLFPPELIEKLMNGSERTIRPPAIRGRLDVDPFDPKKHSFLEADKGLLEVWIPLLVPKLIPPPEEEYVIGCDISFGTGATNSVASVASRKTREKVAQLVTPNMTPDQFALVVAALGFWFNRAFLIWEKNGPGGAFGKRIGELGYPLGAVYMQRNEQGLLRKLNTNLIPGWHSSPENKKTVFLEYVRCLSAGSFINRSFEALMECRQYSYLPSGEIGNLKAYTAEADPSGAKKNHGDRPTADALACFALGAEKNPELGALPYKWEPHPVAYGSWLWRRQEWEKEQRRKGDPAAEWDDEGGPQWNENIDFATIAPKGWE